MNSVFGKRSHFSQADFWFKQGKSLQVDNIKSGIISTYDLTVMVILQNDLTIDLSYKVEYFEPQIIKTLLAQFEQILTAIIKNPLESIAKILPLPIVSPKYLTISRFFLAMGLKFSYN